MEKISASIRALDDNMEIQKSAMQAKIEAKAASEQCFIKDSLRLIEKEARDARDQAEMVALESKRSEVNLQRREAESASAARDRERVRQEHALEFAAIIKESEEKERKENAAYEKLQARVRKRAEEEKLAAETALKANAMV